MTAAIGDTAQPAVRIYSCQEYGDVPIAMSDLLRPDGTVDINEEVNRGFFNSVFSRGTLFLRAEGYVGFVPLNERVAVYIEPRVPLSSLSDVARIARASTRVLATA